MTKLFLAAGVAALAIAAPASADPGGNKGKGGSSKSQSAKANKGGGGNAKAHARADNRGAKRYAMLDRNDKKDRGDRLVVKSRGDDRKVKIKGKDWDRADRVVFRDRDGDRRFDRRYADGRGRGLINGCPPGLFAKDNGCNPPGQLKNRVGQRLSAAYGSRDIPRVLRNLYRDDDRYYYRYADNNYLYRVNRQSNLISSLLPLVAGGLGLGQAFPSAYSNYRVPQSYNAFYRDNDDDYYRYANGYVYEVDRGSGLIENMIPLMAGGYGVGQRLPQSYSSYNLPYQYRSAYADNDDNYYRYAPGSIYQVDRGSNMISGISALLANDLSVGQRLPVGYDAYNVPMAYRDRYYDTPDASYRYNDGNIFRVDPTTQLITAIISAIV